MVAAAAVAAAGTEPGARGRADRVGLGYRPAIAPAFLLHAHTLDIVEVIAEDWLHVDASRQGALRMLGAQVPVLLHGVSLGLADSAPPDPRRLDALARLVERVRPEAWSEHLACVRGGGTEIGHLAAPPYHPRTADLIRDHAAHAAAVVGAAPALENVATLCGPPLSTMQEAQWLSSCWAAVPALLDLHNLWTNAHNRARADHTRSTPTPPPANERDPGRVAHLLDGLPLHRVVQVHCAGGRWIGDGARLLDDHLHPVPPVVWALLDALAERASGPLDVIVERDGAFPAFSDLLAEVDAARAALAAGRSRRHGRKPVAPSAPPTGAPTDAAPLPATWSADLAALYTDAAVLEAAASAPGADAVGLRLAFGSFARKRGRSTAHGIALDSDSDAP